VTPTTPPLFFEFEIIGSVISKPELSGNEDEDFSTVAERPKLSPVEIQVGKRCGSLGHDLCNNHHYCDQDNGVFELNKCALCPCNYHGSCGSQSDLGAPTACVCDEDYYGGNCKAHCSPTATCNSRGNCSALGKCECGGGYGGWWCTIANIDDINGTIAHVEVTLALDIESIPPNSEELSTFEKNFLQDVALLFGVDKQRVQIQRIMPGSVIVIFAVLPAPDGSAFDFAGFEANSTMTNLTIAGYPASGLALADPDYVAVQPQVKQKTYFAREIWMAAFLVFALIFIAGFCHHHHKVKKLHGHEKKKMHGKHKEEKDSLLKKHNEESERMKAEHEANIDTHINHINVLNEKLGDDAPPMPVSSSKHDISTPAHVHLDTWDTDVGC